MESAYPGFVSIRHRKDRDGGPCRATPPGIGGISWRRKLIFGFPTAWSIAETCLQVSGKQIHHMSTHRRLTTTISRTRQTFGGGELGRSPERSYRPGDTRADLGPPIPPPTRLNRGGKLVGAYGEIGNPSSRFGVSHLDKLRACDDLRRARTNSACAIRTPNRPPTWDHIA